jgi:hypothetical protein
MPNKVANRQDVDTGANGFLSEHIGWYRRKVTLCCAAAFLVMPFVTSCGGSDSREHLSSTEVTRTYSVKGRHDNGYRVAYAPNGLQTLVRKQIPGGEFSIIAKRYKYLGRSYSVLEDREERSGERGMGASGGGPDIEAGQHGLLEMDVSRGCLDGHLYAVAYGMLRDPTDLVTERTRDTVSKLDKVIIPASFRPDGVLVYTVLGQGSIDIMTRTQSGRVVTNESYPDREVIVCQH